MVMVIRWNKSKILGLKNIWFWFLTIYICNTNHLQLNTNGFNGFFFLL